MSDVDLLEFTNGTYKAMVIGCSPALKMAQSTRAITLNNFQENSRLIRIKSD